MPTNKNQTPDRNDNRNVRQPTNNPAERTSRQDSSIRNPQGDNRNSRSSTTTYPGNEELEE